MLCRLLILLALVAGALPAQAAHTGYTVGAIRWDPWYEAAGGSERRTMEASLGQPQYQGRAPSCATAPDTKTISFANCGTQAQIDAEITAAANAKLDYWAFTWYGPSHPMQRAWTFYQSSSLKNNINWSLLFASSTLFISETGGSAATYNGYLGQTNYQKVLTSRPLVYILVDSTSNATLATAITAFRSAVTGSGLGSPYIVLLGTSASGVVAATGADAIGDYAFAPAASAAAYSSLTTAVEARWNTLTGTGQSAVPTAMTGWDRRPRIERPVPWEASYQAPYMGMNNYYVAGTTSQIATHVGNMLTWLAANNAGAPAKTSLIYSWDEHDEGGSTLNPSVSGGSAVLTAVGGAL